jgi:hypothetical protein
MLERFQCHIPKAAHLLELANQLPDCFTSRWRKLVDLFASVLRRRYKSGVFECAGMFANGGTANRKTAGKLAGSMRPEGEAMEQFATGRISKCGQRAVEF